MEATQPVFISEVRAFLGLDIRTWDWLDASDWGLAFLVDAVDLLLVTYVVIRIFRLLRGTAAIPIFLGLMVVYFVWKSVNYLGFNLLGDLLGQFAGVGVVALLIVFQQELRAFLIHIGDREVLRKVPKWMRRWMPNPTPAPPSDLKSLVDAAFSIAARGDGALIVLAGKSPLTPYLTAYTAMDAKPSAGLVESIFLKQGPLHDGALIWSQGRLSAVRAVLPLTERPDVPAPWGMRHRAASGITERTDAIALVVSEERGEVSLAFAGQIEPQPNPSATVKRLRQLLQSRNS
jgi:diadenylate cyclase